MDVNEQPIDTTTMAVGRFVDAGVEFAIESPCIRVERPSSDRTAFGSARVHLERSGPYVPDRRLHRTTLAGRVELRSGGVRIQGHVVGSGFEGSAVISPEHPWPTAAIVLPIAHAIADALGGVALHGAAVVVGDRAFVFIGPSGAGKSTACRLVVGARELAADRVVVVPHAGSLRAFRIDAGEPTGLPVVADGVPVAAILRVRHDGVREGVVAGSRTQTLRDLRAACLAPSGSDEARIIDHLLAIPARTHVSTVYTRLDRRIDPGNLR